MTEWELPDDCDTALADVAARFMSVVDGGAANPPDLTELLREVGVEVPPEVELEVRRASDDEVRQAEAHRGARSGRCRLVCKHVQGGTDCFWVCRK